MANEEVMMWCGKLRCQNMWNVMFVEREMGWFLFDLINCYFTCSVGHFDVLKWVCLDLRCYLIVS